MWPYIFNFKHIGHGEVILSKMFKVEPILTIGTPPMINNNFYLSNCRKCGNIVWVGLCWAGFLTRLDVSPLTLPQEIVAKVTGRRTHQIHRTAASFETTPRRGAYLRAVNPIVLADHLCNPSAFRFGEVPPQYFNTIEINPTSEKVPF